MAKDFKLMSMLNPEAHICRVKVYLLYDHPASLQKPSETRGLQTAVNQHIYDLNRNYVGVSLQCWDPSPIRRV